MLLLLSPRAPRLAWLFVLLCVTALVPVVCVRAAVAAPVVVPACATPARPGTARCLARIVKRSRISPKASAAVGLSPADLVAAYGLAAPTSSVPGSGPTVAIVDAYDAPRADADLATYRSRWGLGACTVASGCLRKVDQAGGSRLPRADNGWATEIMLDLDAVSAACPACKILLVEARSPSIADLGTAVDTAVRLGAVAVSNSYGGPEDRSVAAAEAHFRHPGVLLTASSGDDGYGVSYPATSAGVVAVGGTRLTRTAAGWQEVAWSGAGSGCSRQIARPEGAAAPPGCAKRAVADLAAVADPASGLAVFGPTSATTSGWMTVGGTSLSAPLVAAIAARTGGPIARTTPAAIAAAARRLRDVTAGTNGRCTTKVLCSAGAGWDGPTGWGSPVGGAVFGA